MCVCVMELTYRLSLRRVVRNPPTHPLTHTHTHLAPNAEPEQKVGLRSSHRLLGVARLGGKDGLDVKRLAPVSVWVCGFGCGRACACAFVWVQLYVCG